ncbi:MAG TPA: Ig-like domain-containing protein [Cryptosporangiaceae bacterium]|nr:Ig-like domain-containing protein [Cryptosporangiaceae bacterium]
MTLTPHPAVRRFTVALTAVTLAVLTACSGSRSGPADSASSPAGAKVTVSPAAGASRVAPATPVVVTVDNGRLTAVTVRSDDGDVVDGASDPTGRRWTSEGKLSFGATYVVQVTTDKGKPTTSTFRTVPKPGAEESVRTSSTLGDAKTYGIGMPIILRLSRSLENPAQRAAYERALKVRSEPATTGAWGWISGTEVHFRPSAYWAPGSRVRVEVDTAGRPIDDVWGRTDITVDFKIGTARQLVVDSATKQMRVVEGGRVVRTIPVSLGKPKFPSSSGTMVLIDKRPTALFDSSTYGLAVDSPDGYRTKVQYAMRLTWGGEFIHAAPWSVADQGRRNVSHGCINVSTANAAWLFNRAQVGDPVTVKNTETTVQIGNGWSDWTVDFPTWLKRSATGEQQTA